MDKVVIIGGGVIGLSAAWYLQKAGFNVTVLDRGTLEDNCSFGNAGMIVPSHFVPLAAPGMVEQGIRWMFSSKSPFYVRPSLSGGLVRWGLKFLGHANAAHVGRSAVPLRDISLLSSALYNELAAEPGFDFNLQRNGILMMYKTAKAGDEELHLAEKAWSLGLDAKPLSPGECRKLQPALALDIAGAVHYRCDSHLSPHVFMKQLMAALEQKGVSIIRNAEVAGFERNGRQITRILTTSGAVEAQQVVLAAGAWSGTVAGLAGVGLPLMPGKGYSFMMNEPDQRMNIASLLTEARVSVTPMGSHVRFGGTMELGAVNRRINMDRVKGIVEAIPRYFPELRPALPEPPGIWYGFRPCSPDGLPYIGRAKRYVNLIIAAGHGMMGLSLGPATGKLVSELAAGQSPSIDIAAFTVDR